MLADPEIDAVICINDIIASVVYNVIQKRGKTVGEDIAVIGFDDQPFAKEMTPPLATVRADAFELGSRCVEKAYNYLSGIKDDRHLVETRFIPRASCFVDKHFIKAPEMLFVGTTSEIKKNLMDYISDGTATVKDAEMIFTPLSELIDHLENEFFYTRANESSVNDAYQKIVDVFRNDKAFNGETSKLYMLQENLCTWLIRNCL